MKKRLLSLLTVSVLSLGLLTGCESSAETIELGDKVYEKLEPQVKSCIENNIKFVSERKFISEDVRISRKKERINNKV